MGGACRVKTATLFTAGPPCTDNFQVLPFTYLDKLFQSVEQGYQALKFTDEAAVEAIRGIGKTAGETDSAHGMRSWQAGQRQRSGVRADWNAVKVEVMRDVCRAKYESNPEQMMLGWAQETLL